jgi:hypothetical protein
VDWLYKGIEVARPILETLYFIVSILLFASVVIGIKQLKLVKNDMKYQYERAAKEKSIEYLNWFSKELLPKLNKCMKKIEQSDLPNSLGKMNDKFLPDESHNDADVQAFIKKAKDNGILDILNQLEFFSSAIINGVADEKTCYKPMVKAYTYIVAIYYPVICDWRKNDINGFANLMELFLLWNKKLQKENMEFAKQQLEQNIASIQIEDIKSIGM